MSTLKLPGVTGAYTLAARYLHSRGVATIEEAYQALPDMLPRTVRYIWSALLMDSEIQQEPKLPPESLPLESINQITEKAAEAKVSARAALSAVMRFKNSVERVTQVLDDLITLARVHKPAYRPTGLFISKMRNGTDVQLPDIVHDRRKAEQNAAPNRTEPELKVGDWVKYQGDWVVVEALLAGKVRLYAPEGRTYHYFVEGADTDVPLEQASRLPRAAEPEPPV